MNWLFTGMTASATLFGLLILGALLTVIIIQGLPVLSLDFISTPARKFGAEGGVVYQLLGSILLVVCAGFISLPVALGLAIYKSEYLRNVQLQKISQLLLYVLNAVPSIVFGVFGLVFFVNILHTGISWLVGSIILALMMLPTITLSCYQSMISIPHSYRETARALGFDSWQVVIQVVLPQGVGGAITGMLIGLARAVGETAPIMFIATAFSGVSLPQGINSPVSTLPTHILALAKQAVNPQAQANAWGAGLVLLILVLMLSCSALFCRQYFKFRIQR